MEVVAESAVLVGTGSGVTPTWYQLPPWYQAIQPSRQRMRHLGLSALLFRLAIAVASPCLDSACSAALCCVHRASSARRCVLRCPSSPWPSSCTSPSPCCCRHSWAPMRNRSSPTPSCCPSWLKLACSRCSPRTSTTTRRAWAKKGRMTQGSPTTCIRQEGRPCERPPGRPAAPRQDGTAVPRPASLVGRGRAHVLQGGQAPWGHQEEPGRCNAPTRPPRCGQQ